MKRKLLVLGFVILVIANISALVTIAYNRWFKPEEPRFSHGRRHPFAFLRQELSLTEGQMTKLQERRVSFEQQIGEVRSKLWEKRRALMEELRAAVPDSLRIDQLVDEIGILQTEMEKQAIRHMLQEKRILNPEQRGKFFSIFEEHFHRRKMMPRPGGRMGPRDPHQRPFESEKKEK